MKQKVVIKLLIVWIISLLLVASVVSALNNKISVINEIEQNKNHSMDVETIYPTDDAHIRQDYPDITEGDATGMNVRNIGSIGGTWNALIKFNLSSISIPQNAIIKSAFLKCFYYAYKDNNPAGRLFNLYKITDEWNEETVTWNNRPSFSTQPSATTPVPNSPGQWMEWDVTIDFEAFIAGSEQNYGWKISDDSYWGGPDIPITRLTTKEAESQHPYLEINYVILHKTLLIGRITNVDNSAIDYITFDAEFLRFIQLSPFQFNRYTLGEEITVAKSYSGLLTTKFAWGMFNAGL